MRMSRNLVKLGAVAAVIAGQALLFGGPAQAAEEGEVAVAGDQIHYIARGEERNVIEVDLFDGFYYIKDAVRMVAGPGCQHVPGNADRLVRCQGAGINLIHIYANAGSDVVNDTTPTVNIPMSILGGRGDDLIRGQNGNDYIHGGSGEDSIYGFAGNDEVHGGADENRLTGDAGNDTIIGGSQKDTIDGYEGNDYVMADGGNDVVRGGDGDDTILGVNGNDSLAGGDGRDTLDGGAHHNSLDGGPDFDICRNGPKRTACEQIG
jgi:Ca2+-binding RTX toxin-like protein